MTYAAREFSTEGGSPFYLYEFTQGATVFRYTSMRDAIVREGNTWVPLPIIPDKFSISGEFARDELELKVPITSPIGLTFRSGTPETVTAVRILRGHYEDPDLQVRAYWSGRVVNSSMTDNEVSIQCEPIFSLIRHKTLGMIISRTCPHVLYEAGCNVSRATHSATVSVVAVKGTRITIPTISGSAGAYIGGMLTAPDGATRTIISQIGLDIVLSRFCKSLADEMSEHPTGFNVTVEQGCDRTFETCRDRFGNAGNWGGCFLPTSNPCVKAII